MAAVPLQRDGRRSAGDVRTKRCMAESQMLVPFSQHVPQRSDRQSLSTIVHQNQIFAVAQHHFADANLAGLFHHFA